MANKYSVEFEVFVDSIHGSDVITFDDFVDARKCAEKWAETAGAPVIVTQVQRVIVLEVDNK